MRDATCGISPVLADVDRTEAPRYGSELCQDINSEGDVAVAGLVGHSSSFVDHPIQIQSQALAWLHLCLRM